MRRDSGTLEVLGSPRCAGLQWPSRLVATPSEDCLELRSPRRHTNRTLSPTRSTWDDADHIMRPCRVSTFANNVVCEFRARAGEASAILIRRSEAGLMV